MTIAQSKSPLEQCRDALRNFIEGCSTGIDAGAVGRAALAAADAALAAQPEPVAWANSASLSSAGVSRERGGPFDRFTCSEGRTSHHDTPLYAAPVAAPVAQPMTDADLRVLIEREFGPIQRISDMLLAVEVARAIDRAHGITPKEPA